MRFVIITVAPPALAEAIDQIRGPWNQKVGAQEALRYPPHITLRTGLVCPDDESNSVAEAFLGHAARFRSVPVRTQGLFFAEDFVGWSVTTSDDLLALHRGLAEFSAHAKGPQGPFRPHLSLAYGDLGAGGLAVLRSGLESLDPPVPDFTWTIDHVALYHETPEAWVEWSRASLHR